MAAQRDMEPKAKTSRQVPSQIDILNFEDGGTVINNLFNQAISNRPVIIKTLLNHLKSDTNKFH